MADQRDRNLGLQALAIAPAIADRTVAFAGTGGAGGNLVLPFVRQNKVRRIKLIDFDVYDFPNLNSQVGAFHSTLRQSKVKVISDMLRDIDPDIDYVVLDERLTLENIDAFLDGVDVLMDCVDFQSPEIHLALNRRARERGIPVIFGAEVSGGARVIWFSPTGMTFEKYFGLKPGTDRLNLGKMIMRVPPYGDVRALKAIRQGRISAPSMATGGVALGALGVPLLEAVLSGVDVPAPAPIGHWLDGREPGGGRIRFHRLVWWRSLILAAYRTYAGLNPRSL